MRHLALLLACVMPLGVFHAGAPCDPLPRAEPAVEGAGSSQADDLARTIHVLLDGLMDPRQDPHAIARQVSGLGRRAIPVLLEMMDQGLRVPEARSSAVERLSPLERRVLLEALGGFSRYVVVSVVRARTAEGGGPKRATLITAVGQVGVARDLELAIQIAGPSSERGRDSSISQALRMCTKEILQRDGQGYRGLRAMVMDSPADVRGALLAGISDTESARGLRVLVDLLGFSRGFDVTLLMHIGKIGGAIPYPVGDDLRARVRRYLGEEDVRLKRETALALGKLGDFEAVDQLITELGHEVESVRAACHGALEEITGLSFPSDGARWRSWYADQDEWFRDEAPGLFAALDDLDPGVVGHALNQLAQRRLYRSEIAYEVERVLDRDEPGLCRLACAVLKELGSIAQLRALMMCLDDRDNAVVQASLEALVSITGERLPPDIEAWESLKAELFGGWLD